jgi:hypothetical protein
MSNMSTLWFVLGIGVALWVPRLLAALVSGPLFQHWRHRNDGLAASASR